MTTGKQAAPHPFLEKHQDKITGVLECFDRIIFKGYLPISSPEAMESFLARQGILLKDFKRFVSRCSKTIKDHGFQMATDARRPFIYLKTATRKEEQARAIAQRDHIIEGLVCVFSLLESCQSFQMRWGEGKPRLVSCQPRALCLYFYFLDPRFGFIHVRVQTWFPFTVQVYLNAHDWLALTLHKHAIGYQKIDNAFLRIDDIERAQRYAEKFPHRDWPPILEALARKVNPLLKKLLRGMQHYWVTDQAEFATDILFRDPLALKDLYQKLLRHATLCFGAEDILCFLGRKLNGNFQGEIHSSLQKRSMGARVKHRMKGNWIKMYDKHQSVLRIETVINHPREFHVRRLGKRNGELVNGWFPMAKRVTNLGRYAEVSSSSNRRYLEALSVVDDPSEGYRLLDRVCERTSRDGRRHRALNPLSRHDVATFSAVLRGEHSIHGFRNRDIARHLGQPHDPDPLARKRQSARVARNLQLLRAHGLIAKIPRSRRYRLTIHGTIIMTAAVTLRHEALHAHT